MKVRMVVILGLVGVMSAAGDHLARAAEKPGSDHQEGQRTNAAPTDPNLNPATGDSVRRLAEREAQFKESLTEVVLDGIWQMTGKGGLRGNEPLSEPKKERYTIASVVKTGTDHWIVSARIEYADTDVTVPILVRVVWAGDTPMITIDDLAIPLIGAYSARVIFHKGFYSGIWYSNSRNYGGILSGRIVKRADKADRSTTPSDEK